MQFLADGKHQIQNGNFLNGTFVHCSYYTFVKTPVGQKNLAEEHTCTC